MGISFHSRVTHWPIQVHKRAHRHKGRQRANEGRHSEPHVISMEQQILLVASAPHFLQVVMVLHSGRRQGLVSGLWSSRISSSQEVFRLSGRQEVFRLTGRHTSRVYRSMGSRPQVDHPTSEEEVQEDGQALEEDLTVEAGQHLGHCPILGLEVLEGRAVPVGQEEAVRTLTSVEVGAAASTQRGAGWHTTFTGNYVDSPRVLGHTCLSSTVARRIRRSLLTFGHWEKWSTANWT